MGYVETWGVLLGRRDVFEDDQEVTLLTPDRGCLEVRAPHARKSQQTYCGRLEPPNRVNVRLYRARENGRWTLTSAEIERVFADLMRREDLRPLLWPLLALFRDLFPEGHPPGRCLRRLVKALRLLGRNFRPPLLVVDRLLVTTARESGIAFSLEGCRSCGREEARSWKLAPQRGLLCEPCGPSSERTHSLSQPVRELYRSLLNRTWAEVCADSYSTRRLGRLESLLYRLFHHHFEISLEPLKIRQSL